MPQFSAPRVRTNCGGKSVQFDPEAMLSRIADGWFPILAVCMYENRRWVCCAGGGQLFVGLFELRAAVAGLAPPSGSHTFPWPAA